MITLYTSIEILLRAGFSTPHLFDLLDDNQRADTNGLCRLSRSSEKYIAAPHGSSVPRSLRICEGAFTGILPEDEGLNIHVSGTALSKKHFDSKDG